LFERGRQIQFKMKSFANKKILVAFPFAKNPGGMDLIMADIVRILAENRARMAIATVFRRDLKTIFQKYFGIKVRKKIKHYYLFPNLSGYFNPLNPLLLGLACKKAIKGFRPDIICIGEYSYEVLAKSRAKLIRYTFEPVLLDQIVTQKVVKLSPVERVYGHYIKAIAKIAYSDRVNFDRVIYISSWAMKLAATKNLADQIIYPPVSLNKFRAREKEDLITCIGAFSPKKRYELFLEAISKCKEDFEVAICGSLPDNRCPYFVSLLNKIKKLKLEEKVKLYPNLSLEKLEKIISTSKICLSHIEYFGIAVVEQMAAGIVPIVYQKGALWDDVVEHGKYGFGFQNKKGLAIIIDNLIADPKFWNKWSKIARNRAKYFSSLKFQREIEGLFNSV